MEEQELRELVGRRIRAERKACGYERLEDFANRIGMDPSNLSRIEHGADLRVSTLVEVSRALQLEPVLIPKEHVTAVRALLESIYDAETEGSAQQPRFA